MTNKRLSLLFGKSISGSLPFSFLRTWCYTTSLHISWQRKSENDGILYKCVLISRSVLTASLCCAFSSITMYAPRGVGTVKPILTVKCNNKAVEPIHCVQVRHNRCCSPTWFGSTGRGDLARGTGAHVGSGAEAISATASTYGCKEQRSTPSAIYMFHFRKSSTCVRESVSHAFAEGFTRRGCSYDLNLIKPSEFQSGSSENGARSSLTLIMVME